MNRRKVSLKADGGNAFPAVDYTWFVDTEKKADGEICDFEVNALDNINSVATGKSTFSYSPSDTLLLFHQFLTFI